MDWSTTIRRYRIVNAMNQERLAEILGVEQSTVSRWERGKQRPDAFFREKIIDLIKNGSASEDFRLLHFVRNNLYPVTLIRDDMTLLTASNEIVERFAIDIKDLEGFNYRRYANEAVTSNFRSAIDCGFFAGEVASITHLVQVKALDGRDLYLRDLWHPARISDGSITAMITAKFLSETEYEQTRTRIGSIRVVMMQDLLSEEARTRSAFP